MFSLVVVRTLLLPVLCALFFCFCCVAVYNTLQYEGKNIIDVCYLHEAIVAATVDATEVFMSIKRKLCPL